MNNEPVAIVELGGEITWLTDVLPYKAKLYTYPVKELTDEEIYQTWVEAKNTALNTRGSDFVEVIFARAILRKAQEK
jgi:predicted nuclease of predicted toxin-antitoxin system